MTLNTFDRRSAILEHLLRSPRASTRQLSALFGVSEVTIRKDLAMLEADGQLVRKHGGAVLPVSLQSEQPFDLRRAQHRSEKAQIARAAARLVQPGDHILLDASSTSYQLAQELLAHRDVVVATNNVQTAAVLVRNPALEVVLIGGVVRGDNWSVVGMLAQEMLTKLHARHGFFGAAGLTPERGLTDADEREVQIKRAMIAVVDQVHVLLDSSKFGQQSFLTYARLADVDHLITDHAIPQDYQDLCRQHNITLTVV